MKVALRLGASGMAGAMGAALIALVLLPWMGSDVGELYRTFVAERLRREDLTTRDEVVLRRLDFKQGVTRDLIDGRITLTEAADRFERFADDETDDDAEDTRPPAVRRSETYRQVITWVSVSLQRQPEQQREVVGRLTRDLALLGGGARPTQ